jgi:hypothetical protein
VVSDFGGKAEVKQYCPRYGGPSCIYPWYSANGAGTFHYGGGLPRHGENDGQAGQFAQTRQTRHEQTIIRTSNEAPAALLDDPASAHNATFGREPGDQADG